MKAQSFPPSRVLIISNRLPVTVSEKEGGLVFEESIGGLSTSISACLRSLNSVLGHENYLWIGWNGAAIDNSKQEEVKSKLHTDHNAYPIFFSQEDIDLFYNGFCNKIVWPLFHGFTCYRSFILASSGALLTHEYETSLWRCGVYHASSLVSRSLRFCLDTRELAWSEKIAPLRRQKNSPFLLLDT